jgi:uroporphyrinogen-III synthase
MTRVLVTRPEPAASKTAAKLAGKGYSVTVLPLTRIVPLPLVHVYPAGSFDAVAATSANAIRHAPEDLIARLRDLPAFAVGESTERAFRRRGFADVHTSGGDARALAVLVGGQKLRRLAYLCGRIRTPVFEDEIGCFGLESTAIETYDAENVRYEADFLGKCLAEPFDAVLLYSARAAEAFGTLLESGLVEPALFARTRFLCLSGKVAGALPRKWQERTVRAISPEERALFGLLANR